ncbi:hypothetical protein C2G38_2061780 [Gigaspora rosea]|uniref:Uncharacterized protein n=1 Tax=Gigaspora rosea TaxID=44941 RepID=A0A397W072_9GLOM|nr:hypothetical protein C2G38_2061780 [Gigaspora rosea]
MYVCIYIYTYIHTYFFLNTCLPLEDKTSTSILDFNLFGGLPLCLTILGLLTVTI